LTKLKEEVFKLLPPTIYFFVALHLVMFIHVLMLKGTAIYTSSSISIAVAALILGNAVLVADMVPMINRFPNKPLTYNIAWKTAIYLLISAVLHYLERLIDFWRETGSFVAGNERLLSLIIWALPLVSEDSVKQAAFRDGKASYNDIVWWPNIQSRD
jgi:hypothetical protein